MDINGRFVARLVMGLAGAGLLVLGGFSYHSNRITLRDVIGLAVVLVVGAIAALWLRLHRADGGQS